MDEMYEMAPDSPETPDVAVAADMASPDAKPEASLSDQALVRRLLKEIHADKKHFKKAFDRMKDNMAQAMSGRDKFWGEDQYRANITGQHVKQKTASLYAKNPKVTARRKESMDFAVWDETQESLMLAMGIVQQAAMAQAAAPTMIDPITGAAVPAEPMLPPGFAEAQAVVQDFQQGIHRRTQLKKFGRSLELVFAEAMRQQTPLDFKTAVKKVVRRAVTTGVGYIELDFQRKYGVPAVTNERLADSRGRLEHIKMLAEKAADGEADELSAERAELEAAISALEAEPQIVLRSGLTFDFPQSTQVIPDRRTKSLVGFVGARRVTLEYEYSVDDVREIFNVDLGHLYTPYSDEGKRGDAPAGVDYGDSEQGELNFPHSRSGADMVRVFKVYDKPSGAVYFLCDGHPNFLRPPTAPSVSVPRFWPIYALTFNDVESEDELFPLSDVELIAPMQREVNRSRQGKREHRDAARPRWAYATGALDEQKDVPNLQNAKAFDAIQLNIGIDADIRKILQPIPVPGVDPNLYDTGEVMQDAQLTVGAQAAQLGGLAKATATEAAIAEGSSSSSDSSSIDDLDSFLTMLARDGGQILMGNMTRDDVIRVAGPGAVWVEDLGLTPEDIFDEVYLEVEAGSTGKPNQALEIRNLKEIGPLLLQVGSIPSEWLAREMLRRLDDRLDLTDAIATGLPAIVAQNRMTQPAAGDPAADPNAQGDKGGDKGPKPPGNDGSGPAMGGNQTM